MLLLTMRMLNLIKYQNIFQNSYLQYLLLDIYGAEPKELHSDETLECVLAFVEGIIYPKNLGNIIIDTDIFMDEIKIIRVRNYYGENYIEQMVKTETFDRINDIMNVMGYHIAEI